MIRPDGLLLRSNPLPICNPSLMGEVAEKQITKLGSENTLSTTGDALRAFYE